MGLGTGSGRGGARPGAGRPRGSKNRHRATPGAVRRWLDGTEHERDNASSTQRDIAEIKALLQDKRAAERREYESLPALLRRVTEIERLLKATELHIPQHFTRRRLT